MTVILVLGRQREEDLKTGQPGLHIKVTLLPTPFHLSPHSPCGSQEGSEGKYAVFGTTQVFTHECSKVTVFGFAISFFLF